jgi:hypothetical protein
MGFETKVPDTVQTELARDLYVATDRGRRAIKNVATSITLLREEARPHPNGEVGANVTLALRHLEDASMRLGKVLQALDGGVSVYDKASTVESPKPI